MDSTNLPDFDTQQFEGQLERPITKTMFYLVGVLTVLASLAMAGRAVDLQITRGAEFNQLSIDNTLRQIVIFPERGVIYDRIGIELAWNDGAGRAYVPGGGFGHLLGYVSYPREEEIATSGYHPKSYIGRAGAERAFNRLLGGRSGLKVEEVNVQGQISSDYLYQAPEDGQGLKLSIDSRIQTKLFETIKNLSLEKGFTGGAGLIMDVRTGQLLAATSYPEYDSNVLSRGQDRAAISGYLNDASKPFLNRIVDGLYTPGSTVKPIMALGALAEKVISPDKEILSTGALTVPNPYFPDQPSVFKDWKAHGLVNMERALAMSSNVYFYEIGGGYEDQRGIGISGIEKYARLFGLGQPIEFELGSSASGVIPTPAWKAKQFAGEPWRLGDTYHTVIGQYGFQVTPLHMVRMMAAIANGGKLLMPSVQYDLRPEEIKFTNLPFLADDFEIVRRGLRRGVEEGTGMGLSVPYVQVAAKTGTAELGVEKTETSSWALGFFPYEAPRYAFAVVMERGPKENLVGGVYVMRQMLDWLHAEASDYLQPSF